MAIAVNSSLNKTCSSLWKHENKTITQLIAPDPSHKFITVVVLKDYELWILLAKIPFANHFTFCSLLRAEQFVDETRLKSSLLLVSFLFIQQLQIVGVDVSVCQIFVLGVSLFNEAVCVRCCRHAGVLFGISNTVATIPGMLAPTVAGVLTPNVSSFLARFSFLSRVAARYCYRVSVLLTVSVLLSHWWPTPKRFNNYVVRRTIQLMFLTFQGQTSQSKVLGFILKGGAK